MRRVTITVSGELEEALERYMEGQDGRPAFTSVAQAALRQHLAGRGYLTPSQPLRITPAARGSGSPDGSIAHDRPLV